MIDTKQTIEEHNFPDRKEWVDALNQAPESGWIKKRSLGGNKNHSYVPIAIKQALADIFFDEFDVFNETYQQMENEILCTVKINVLPSYPNANPRTISGTGAKPIAARSGSAPEKFPVGKITNSLEYCAPKARISAIANALETFANIFGRNLGRSVSADLTANKNFVNNGEDSKKKKKKKKK